MARHSKKRNKFMFESSFPEGRGAGEMKKIDTSNLEVRAGEWTEVPVGKVMAPECYVDEDGILRYAGTGAMAVWHWNHRDQKRCERSGFTAQTVMWVVNAEGEKIPWCPDCWCRKVKWEHDKALKAMREHKGHNTIGHPTGTGRE